MGPMLLRMSAKLWVEKWQEFKSEKDSPYFVYFFTIHLWIQGWKLELLAFVQPYTVDFFFYVINGWAPFCFLQLIVYVYFIRNWKYICNGLVKQILIIVSTTKETGQLHSIWDQYCNVYSIQLNQAQNTISKINIFSSHSLF